MRFGGLSMTSFEKLKKALEIKNNKDARKTRGFIACGFCTDWPDDMKKISDDGLKRWATPARWEAYTAGRLNRDKFVNVTCDRADKHYEKRLEKDLEKLEAIENAPAFDSIQICIKWINSYAWGSNPRAVLTCNNYKVNATRSGCNYDKRAAVVADVLNECPEILKLLCENVDTLKDNGRYISGLCPGDVLPTFDGCGVYSTFDVLEKVGLHVNYDFTNTKKDVITITKGEKRK